MSNEKPKEPNLGDMQKKVQAKLAARGRGPAITEEQIRAQKVTRQDRYRRQKNGAQNLQKNISTSGQKFLKLLSDVMNNTPISQQEVSSALDEEFRKRLQTEDIASIFFKSTQQHRADIEISPRQSYCLNMWLQVDAAIGELFWIMPATTNMHTIGSMTIAAAAIKAADGLLAPGQTREQAISAAVKENVEKLYPTFQQELQGKLDSPTNVGHKQEFSKELDNIEKRGVDGLTQDITNNVMEYVTQRDSRPEFVKKGEEKGQQAYDQLHKAPNVVIPVTQPDASPIPIRSDDKTTKPVVDASPTKPVQPTQPDKPVGSPVPTKIENVVQPTIASPAKPIKPVENPQQQEQKVSPTASVAPKNKFSEMHKKLAGVVGDPLKATKKNSTVVIQPVRHEDISKYFQPEKVQTSSTKSDASQTVIPEAQVNYPNAPQMDDSVPPPPLDEVSEVKKEKKPWVVDMSQPEVSHQVDSAFQAADSGEAPLMADDAPPAPEMDAGSVNWQAQRSVNQNPSENQEQGKPKVTGFVSRAGMDEKAVAAAGDIAAQILAGRKLRSTNKPPITQLPPKPQELDPFAAVREKLAAQTEAKAKKAAAESKASTPPTGVSSETEKPPQVVAQNLGAKEDDDEWGEVAEAEAEKVYEEQSKVQEAEKRRAEEQQKKLLEVERRKAEERQQQKLQEPQPQQPTINTTDSSDSSKKAGDKNPPVKNLANHLKGALQVKRQFVQEEDDDVDNKPEFDDDGQPIEEPKKEEKLDAPQENQVVVPSKPGVNLESSVINQSSLQPQGQNLSDAERIGGVLPEDLYNKSAKLEIVDGLASRDGSRDMPVSGQEQEPVSKLATVVENPKPDEKNSVNVESQQQPAQVIVSTEPAKLPVNKTESTMNQPDLLIMGKQVENAKEAERPQVVENKKPAMLNRAPPPRPDKTLINQGENVWAKTCK